MGWRQKAERWRYGIAAIVLILAVSPSLYWKHRHNQRCQLAQDYCNAVVAQANADSRYFGTQGEAWTDGNAHIRGRAATSTDIADFITLLVQMKKRYPAAFEVRGRIETPTSLADVRIVGDGPPVLWEAERDLNAASSPAPMPLLDLAADNVSVALHAQLGQRIKIRGHWNGNGKLGGYVYGRRNSGQEVVYLKLANHVTPAVRERINRIREDGSVVITGVLRLYEPPESDSSTANPLMDRTSKHFFVDAHNAEIVALP